MLRRRARAGPAAGSGPPARARSLGRARAAAQRRGASSFPCLAGAGAMAGGAGPAAP